MSKQYDAVITYQDQIAHYPSYLFPFWDCGLVMGLKWIDWSLPKFNICVYFGQLRSIKYILSGAYLEFWTVESYIRNAMGLTPSMKSERISYAPSWVSWPINIITVIASPTSFGLKYHLVGNKAKSNSKSINYFCNFFQDLCEWQILIRITYFYMSLKLSYYAPIIYIECEINYEIFCTHKFIKN